MGKLPKPNRQQHDRIRVGKNQKQANTFYFLTLGVGLNFDAESTGSIRKEEHYRNNGVNMQNWIHSDTAVHTILRFWPMTLAWFERQGIDPWHWWDSDIETACHSVGITFEDFEKGVRKLPEPGPASDWGAAPIYCLVDFLCHQHRIFLGDKLPHLRSLLSKETSSHDADARDLRALYMEYLQFSLSLQEHLRQEESFFFPKILHNDYWLRHKQVDPDFASGSACVFIALHGMEMENAMEASIHKLTQTADKAAGSLGVRASAKLTQALHVLLTELKEHSRLESEILYPMVIQTERALYDACIRGDGSRSDAHMSEWPA